MGFFMISIDCGFFICESIFKQNIGISYLIIYEYFDQKNKKSLINLPSKKGIHEALYAFITLFIPRESEYILFLSLKWTEGYFTLIGKVLSSLNSRGLVLVSLCAAIDCSALVHALTPLLWCGFFVVGSDDFLFSLSYFLGSCFALPWL